MSETTTIYYKIDNNISNKTYSNLTTRLSSDINDTKDVVNELVSSVKELDDTKDVVSKLVSSVKELEIQKKVNKRKRWISALKTRRRYF